MFNKNLSKAVSTDQFKPFLCYVYFCKEAKSYVATDASIMLIEKTTDQYDGDKFFSPRTGLIVDVDVTFPSWQKVIPEDAEAILNRTFQLYQIKEKARMCIQKVAKIRENTWVDAKYLAIVLDFVGKDFDMSQEERTTSRYKPIKFVSKDKLRTAILMPIQSDDESIKERYSKTSEFLDSLKGIKSGDVKKIKYVYLAFDKDNNVLGVFNKKSDADAESIGIVKEFAIL